MDCKNKLSVTNRFWLAKKMKTYCPGKESLCKSVLHGSTEFLSSAAQSVGVNMGCENCMGLLSYVVQTY